MYQTPSLGLHGMGVGKRGVCACEKYLSSCIWCVLLLVSTLPRLFLKPPATRRRLTTVPEIPSEQAPDAQTTRKTDKTIPTTQLFNKLFAVFCCSDVCLCPLLFQQYRSMSCLLLFSLSKRLRVRCCSNNTVQWAIHCYFGVFKCLSVSVVVVGVVDFFFF